MDINNLTLLLQRIMTSRDDIMKEARAISALVNEAKDDDDILELLLICQYGPVFLGLGNQLSGYLQKMTAGASTVVALAETAMSQVRYGQQFMTENPKCHQAILAYLAANGAPKSVYLQTTRQIGDYLINNPNGSAAVRRQYADIVAQYGEE